MTIQKLIADHLADLLADQFPGKMVEHVKIEDISVDEASKVITIKLTVDTTVDPKAFAESYFGLTGKFRKTLRDSGEVLEKFIPVITPSIRNGVHA